jgi:hypothetical protein
MLYVLITSLPRGVEVNSVLPRGGPKHRAWTRGIAPPEEFTAGSCIPNPAPLPPHARGRNGTTRWSSARQPAAGCIPSVPPVGGWLGPARRGEGVPGPKFAAGTATGAAGGFLGRREGQKPVGFCPLGGAHQSAWSLYIMLGHTPTGAQKGGVSAAGA